MPSYIIYIYIIYPYRNILYTSSLFRDKRTDVPAILIHARRRTCIRIYICSIRRTLMGSHLCSINTAVNIVVVYIYTSRKTWLYVQKSNRCSSRSDRSDYIYTERYDPRDVIKYNLAYIILYCRRRRDVGIHISRRLYCLRRYKFPNRKCI